MLLRVIYENFLSFREPVQIDMFPNLRRTTHWHHIYPHKIPVVKAAAIYGANGSGKSNIVKGLEFIHDFASTDNFFRFKENEKRVGDYIHKGGDSEAKNLSITVEFETEGKYFIYSFELDEEKIGSEQLLLSGLGEKDNELIFRRNGNEIESGTAIEAAVMDAVRRLIASNPTTSLLHLNERFPIINDPRMRMAAKWLCESLVVVPYNAIAHQLIHMMDSNPGLLGFTRDVSSKVDLGLKDISIRKESHEDWRKNKSHQRYPEPVEIVDGNVYGLTQDNRQVFIAEKDNNQTFVKEFVFSHLGKRGRQFEMDITSESEGTVRLLNLIPALHGAIKSEKTIIIDEIDHSIHPTLVFALVRMFADAETNGQLIFTTHETCLLNQQVLLRPDEVWFVEKHEGASKAYSLNDFKEHNTLSVERGYIEGRFGAIPFIGDIEWLL